LTATSLRSTSASSAFWMAAFLTPCVARKSTIVCTLNGRLCSVSSASTLASAILVMIFVCGALLSPAAV
jgi:hypothetical protein